MIFNLVKKEFIRSRSERSKNIWVNLIQVFFKLVFLALFIAFECITLMALDKKINEYSPYGTFDFLVLYNFVALILTIVILTIKARSIFYNYKDNKVVSVLPVSPEKIVFSKCFYLFVYSTLILEVLLTPSLIIYARREIFYAYYYLFIFVFPILLSFFTVGIAAVLSPILEFIYRLIKNKDITQFILACFLIIGLCFAYQYVLKLFLTALSDSSIGGMFDMEFVNLLHTSTDYFFPIINMLRPIMLDDHNKYLYLILFVTIIMIVCFIGFYVSVYFYTLFNNKMLGNKNVNNQEKDIEIDSPTKSLFKKELAIIFKNNTYIFSYTSLLILAPFLTFAVISSLNLIVYQNLRFFSSYFPDLVNGINITLILLFSSVINASAALSIKREEKALQIVKYIPVSPLKQLFIKFIVPLTLSSFSLIISLVVLISTGTIDVTTFFISLLLGVILITADNALSIEWDMHDRGESKLKLAPLNTGLAIGFPLIILIIHMAMSFTYCPSYSIYIVESICGLILILSSVLFIRTRYIKNFNKMEVH